MSHSHRFAHACTEFYPSAYLLSIPYSTLRNPMAKMNNPPTTAATVTGFCSWAENG